MIDLLARLEWQAAARPAQAAFTDGAALITYAGLLRRVAGAAEAFSRLPPVIGLLADDSVDWVVADLAVGAAGKTLVPVPTFFSREQRQHLLADAGVAHLLIDASCGQTGRSLGLPCSLIPRLDASTLPRTVGAERIIYTSGSTGKPKGVRVGGRQIAHSVTALAEASGASAEDRHLSLLPFSLLLEQICGIYVVLHAGASSHVAAGVAARCAQGDLAAIVEACEVVQPTTSVLVPQLLAALAGGYAAAGRRAPQSLRFVAVGGAPVPARLLDAAWDAGIPACVGYGLSECCSVVTVNRPGSRSYSAGPALPGIKVLIDDGEIVIAGPTVMQGYLGGGDPRGCWRSGDLGRLDAEGSLTVLGRKDNRLVTANGRNISPEWVEAAVERDRRVGRCVAICDGDGRLTAVIVPACWDAFGEEEAAAIVGAAVRDLPTYARPAACIMTSEDHLQQEGLLNSKGEPRRAALARHFDGTSHSLLRTAPARERPNP